MSKHDENKMQKIIVIKRNDKESRLKLSEETLKGIAEAEEDIRKGRIFTSRQIKNQLGF